MKITDAKTREVSTDLQVSTTSNRVSLFGEGRREEIVYMRTDALTPFKYQARENFDEEEIDDLATTVKEHGIRQPLTVLKRDNGVFEVVSGERRLRAAVKVGLKKVPVIVLFDEKKAEEIALIENVQRTDLTLMELGQGFLGLLERGTFSSQTELAQKLGIQRTKVVEALALSRLPQEIKDLIKEHAINSRDVLRQLINAPSLEDKKNLIEKYVKSLKVHVKEPTQKDIVKTQSIFRISLSPQGLKLQKSRLRNLDVEDKMRIVTLLQEVIDDLSKDL